jgi:exosortase
LNAIPSRPAARPGETSDRTAGSFRRWWLLPFAVLWLLPCVGLAVHWKINPQYHFGWFVPLLALSAAWNRWRTRPVPGAPQPLGLGLATVLALAVFPTWLFCQPNPDWPLLNWLFTAEVAACTLGVVAAVGGWSWASHFFFPAVLIFTAVPWPDQIEAPVIQAMMRAVAGTGVVLLDLIGVTALQHGNLIEVGTGTVGVDEACSGIRSLQGSLMASLVLGELFRFNLPRRAVLVGASLAAAFATNVLRAGFLAWSAARSGIGAVERWHDPAGLTILLVCVGIIFAVALFLDRDSASPVVLARVPPAASLPRWFVPALAGWLVVTLVATELWYYDAAPPPESRLRFTPPLASVPVKIPAAAQALIRSDRATTARWTAADGGRWVVYFFEWNFGPAFARVAAQMHRPDVCLPASGRELHEDRGAKTFAVGAVSIPLNAFSFQEGNEMLFVYQGISQVRSARGLRHGPLGFYKQTAALRSVLWRERDIGQQVIELALTGYRDGTAADAAVARMLPQIFEDRSRGTLDPQP